MTTLEKVARAIKAGRGCDADDIHCGFCLWGPDERTKEWDETGCIWLARGALESLKDPEPAIIHEGEEVYCAAARDNVSTVWNAMLNAIINEKES